MVSELSAKGAIPASIVEAAAAGDTMAFARIVQAHHDDMARVCQVITGDPDMAQDAAQAAWPIAWRKLRSIRDPEKLRPWLVTVAANEARQMLRKQHRDRLTTLDVADVGSHRDDPASRPADTDLLAAIRLLPPDDRALLSLRYVAGFDATEIGKALGITSSGVRSRLSRLVDRLRPEVGDVSPPLRAPPPACPPDLRRARDPAVRRRRVGRGRDGDGAARTSRLAARGLADHPTAGHSGGPPPRGPRNPVARGRRSAHAPVAGRDDSVRLAGSWGIG